MADEEESGRNGLWSMIVIAVIALVGAIVAVKRMGSSKEEQE